jgi:excisionase family DNA binding protein
VFGVLSAVLVSAGSPAAEVLFLLPARDDGPTRTLRWPVASPAGTGQRGRLVSYVEGFFFPASELPALKRLVDAGRRSTAVPPDLAVSLRRLDAAVAVQRRGAPVTSGSGRFAGWLGVSEAASVLGYDPRHVRRLCQSGSLRAVKSDGGRDWLIEPTEVDRIAA